MKTVTRVMAVLQSCLLSCVNGIGVMNNNANSSIPLEYISAAVTETNSHSQLSLVQTEGVRAQSSNSVQITATVKDTNGGNYSNQSVSWSYAFKNAPSSYGAANNYVKMTSSGSSATFTLLRPFAYQIIVTCTYTGDTSIKATATLDYCQRVSAVQLNFNDEITDVSSGTVIKEFDLSYEYGGTGWNNNIDLTYGFIQSVGSVSDRIKSYEATIEPTPEYGQAVNEATSMYFGNPAWLEKIYFNTGTFRELLEAMYYDTMHYPFQASYGPIVDMMQYFEGEFIVTVTVRTQRGTTTFEYVLDLMPSFVPY